MLKGSRKDWHGLPKDKSLFGNEKGVGLPIGNLTSQMFGNLYLNDLDRFIKQDLGIKYYGRYVDDMLFVHEDKAYLKAIISKIQAQIKPIGLKLHPKKIYLQPYQHGVLFLGQYIKPYRNYVSNRVKASFYQTLRKVNELLVESERIEWVIIKSIQSKLNAYLGILKHASSYQLIKKATAILIKRFYCFFAFAKNYTKVTINKGFWQWHYLAN
ncbi:RNA-directed DNA polymerase [Bathymodiolus septemdierum thioautotrophic gill symbiont]|uniref:RNA-directed DNA polymerase n=1 Tax=Bathymodiolus septemdierum thioautotrophic gill symbiont TaxID=113267 RepID=UPI000824CE15|nr:RNA-directed DNA polymerase [Bathymodiolus septemdierum thioautotrophic gill symbiont]